MEQSKDYYTKFDEKTIATIKASVIWSVAATLIMSVASMLASYFFLKNFYNSMMSSYGQYFNGYMMNQVYRPQMIDFAVLLNDVVWGAIGGAVAGYIIAKFYPVLADWQKKFLGNKLNSFFKILFWPYLAILAISLVLTGATRVINSAFIVFVIIIIADIVSVYLYAKMMDKAVGKYYK